MHDRDCLHRFLFEHYPIRGHIVHLDASWRALLEPCIAVPADGPVLRRIFGDTQWHKGVWHSALKQAPPDIVLRDLGNAQVVKINGSAKRCLMIDLDAFERFTSKAE